jgi:hypothetical protein
VSTVFQIALFQQIAVRQQHGITGLVGPQRDRETAHHIGTVQEISNASKTLGFTLGEERVLTDVQA